MNYLKAILAATIILSTITITQAQSINKGDLSASASIGLLPTYFMDGGTTITPPVQVGAEYRIAEVISIGAFAGYSNYEGLPYENLDGSVYQVSTESMMAGLRLGVHTTTFDKVDLYGGFQVGYATPSVEFNVLNPGEQRFPRPKVREGLVYSGYVGIAGSITDRIGVFGEIGYGISLISAGVKTRIFTSKK